MRLVKFPQHPSVDKINKILNNECEIIFLNSCFRWDETVQGAYYWREIAQGNKELSSQDRLYLNILVALRPKECIACWVSPKVEKLIFREETNGNV